MIEAVWWVYLWAFLLEVASIVFLPARDASIPDLVDDDELETANALVLGSSYGCIPLGAGAFALVAALSQGLDGRLALAPVFWIDAATFVFSFLMIRRLRLPDGTAGDRVDHPADRPAEGQAAPAPGGLRAAFRIPLVRAVLVPAGAAAIGVGVLFSIGIVFVRETLGATNVEFAVLIALFGVGAGLGLLVLQQTEASDLTAVHVAVATQGVTIALMSLSPTVLVAYLGAVVFGAAAAAALAAGMSAVQRELDGDERVLAFTAFHVVIRVALSIAAVGAGVAADLLGRVEWPVLGLLEATRVVLLGAGAVVLLGAAGLARVQRDEAVRRLGDDTSP